ncbi:Xaa-Pro peptidase family protein [Verrucomicrobiales bacterium]|jgi:Xaa-Pro dipeptidase|nr:Xaa-Pro peptidase family protein [Verrucomicrobiales bacterium]MDA7926551.1 Xaa-Pro peptidase family protein [Verrucomicrobiales bacterium]
MSFPSPPLDGELCRLRQNRLREYLAEKNLEGAIFFNRHYVYSLSGYWHEQPLTPAAILVERDGDTTIFTHDESADAPAADRNVTYVPNHLFTLKPNLSGCLAEVLNPLLKNIKTVGTAEQTPSALISGPDCLDISEDYQYLRRRKDADEVAAFEFTIQCAERAYATAREAIKPGVTEVEVMAAMQESATLEAGEFLSGWGQDFQCGGPGGFARHGQKIEAGELYVLDVGVGVRGYRSDLCRTFSVDNNPTEAQQEAHAHIIEVMTMGEAMLRPGQSCKEMYDQVNDRLDGWNGYQFFHHAGHGVGLDAHEVPRINPAWDDTFEVGDLVAFEPGLYGPELRGGIRLENNYLITEEGHRQLSHFPLALT